MCLNTPKLLEHYYCPISFFFLFEFIFVILLHLLGAINFLLKILKTQIQENVSDFLHYFHHIIKMFTFKITFDSYQFTWLVSFGAWNWFLSSFMNHLIMCLSERERERSGVKMFDLLLIWSFHIFIQASIYNIIHNICTTSTKCVIIWSSQLNCI